LNFQKKKKKKKIIKMTRGYSLEKDLRLLINDPKYSDIEILYEEINYDKFKNKNLLILKSFCCVEALPI
jgi:hypothetical protein